MPQGFLIYALEGVEKRTTSVDGPIAISAGAHRNFSTDLKSEEDAIVEITTLSSDGRERVVSSGTSTDIRINPR